MVAQLSDKDAPLKLSLDGIKFSEPQTRVTIKPGEKSIGITTLLDLVFRNRINLSQLYMRIASPELHEYFLDEKDYLRFAHLLNPELEEWNACSIVATSVGKTMLFPHGSDPGILFSALKQLAGSGVPIHSVCSSLSALCVITNYQSMDELAESLLELFELPAGHSPFRYQPSELDRQLSGGTGRKIETRAKYWEPIIKIYGTSLETGLESIRIRFAREQLESVCFQFMKSGKMDFFKMMSLNGGDSGTYELFLVLRAMEAKFVRKYIAPALNHNLQLEVEIQSGLAVLHLHGPHFQDRYGVANSLVDALATADIAFDSLNCSGTSIYLVLNENLGSCAQKALEKVFVVP
ncbi:MAG: hypothetical protein D6B25_09895 [Desulfobulbaceae bacterium]|nr:MAG: hypothetical protein D6B25_09895 [Desulfobulbaceae bacterium]